MTGNRVYQPWVQDVIAIIRRTYGSSTDAGSFKVGSGLSVDSNGVLSATGGGGGVAGTLILGGANATQILSNQLSYVGAATAAYF